MKLRLTKSVLSALRRPISGGIVTKRFSPNCTATRQQRANRRRRLTVKFDSCVMVNTPAGTSVKALFQNWRRGRQSNDTTKQTPAYATASNFARTLLLASVSMHCWHIIAAAALSSTQQTHDALGGAQRGGTRPTARCPHGIAINISSFSPRCHTRHTNRSIVNFDFSCSLRISTCQTTELFLM